jgi:YfiH family protein
MRYEPFLRLGEPPFRPHDLPAADYLSSLANVIGRGTKVITLRQVHGARVIDADLIREGTGPVSGDGLVTTRPGVAVGIWTADCLPILLAAPEGTGVAALHAGWRGLLGGIISAGVRCLSSASLGPAEGLRAAIGPAAGRCCYEIGEDLAERVKERFGERTGALLGRLPSGRTTFSLRDAARLLLLDAGIPAGNITVMETCTICDTAHFPSYRREGAATGRILSLAMLR